MVEMILKYPILEYCFHLFLFPLKGHNVTEVAHDCVIALKNWFQGRGIRNSFDTWHGRFIRDTLPLALQDLWCLFNVLTINEHVMKVLVYCLHSMIGTKGVAKEMKKICSGPRRDEGVKWFTELSDKGIENQCLKFTCWDQEGFVMEREHSFPKVSC